MATRHLNRTKIAVGPSRRAVLLVGSSDYQVVDGGTNKVILDQSRLLLEAGYRVIGLFPLLTAYNRAFSEKWILYEDNQFKGVCSTASAVSFIGACNIATCFLHHIMRIPPSSVARVLMATKAKIVFYVHDFATICSSATMISPERGYCGLDYPSKSCGECSFAEESLRLYDQYKSLFKSLKGRLEVVAPSQSAADKWEKAFGKFLGLSVKVVPHLEVREVEPCCSPVNPRLKFAFVGYQVPHKGSLQWGEIVRRFSSRYDLYHFGKQTSRNNAVTEVSVDFHNGENVMTEALLKENIDCAILYSTWPETYSFTYYECTSACCFILTSSLSGNIAEQVYANKNGLVFETDDELFRFLGADDTPLRIAAFRRGVVSRDVYSTSKAFMELIDDSTDSVDVPATAVCQSIDSVIYRLWRYLKGRAALRNMMSCVKRGVPR